MKSKSYIFVIVIAIVAAFFISNKDANDNSIDYSNGIPSHITDEADDDNNNKPSTSYRSYYNQLTSEQKKFYDAILPVIANAEKQVTFSNVNANTSDFKDDCFTATTAIQYDHPEYFWYTGGFSYSFSRMTFENNGTVVLEPIYYEYVSALYNSKSQHSELEKAVKNVASLARSHSSNDYERIMFVHDYLIENAIYDHDALKEYYKTSHNPSCEYIFSAYGCLVNKKTVCSGYAKAFQLILQELGYECSYVTGDAGEAHGWNCVYLDGEGYYVDVTWDDYDLEHETPMYNYAFITSNALSRTHTVDMLFPAPVCNATTYNYFRQNGYYCADYSFKSASEIMSKQANNEAVHIQFGSLNDWEEAYNELIRNGKAANINGIDNFQKITYNKDHYTLTFFNP